MPVPSENNTTDDTVALPWKHGEPFAAPSVLHLVVAWVIDEPDRVGQVARIDRACFLGRGHDGMGDVPAVEFMETRPGESLSAPLLQPKTLSRRQLVFDPLSESCVRVDSVGKRRLFHNGLETRTCEAQAGDVLVLEHSAVFLVALLPTALPPLRHYPSAGFRFGEADPDDLVGESSAAWALRDALGAAAASGQHVLLTGESGSGKEVAARVVHRLGGRAGALVARSAATFPEGLVDAELFGSARGYPNAGVPEREGLVGAANGGTLFLDEIGELPEAAQARLLRVLDSGGEYHRLGESRARRSDFRLIAATNRDLSALKHDVLARFTVRVEVPGLDARKGDVPLLARELLGRMAVNAPWIRDRFFEKGEPRMHPELMTALLRHRYTHHARELMRLLQCSLGSSSGNYLALTEDVRRALEMSLARAVSSYARPAGSGDPTRDEIERALRVTASNATAAAELLGISRGKIRRLMARYQVRQ
jgi:DNA-binding NtrC family response regulator